MPCSLPPPWALAAASALVGAVEQAALNPLTIARSRAFAGRKRSFRKIISSWAQWTAGLPLLICTQVGRNIVGYGGWAVLTTLGIYPVLAGAMVGGFDGFMFTPSRRVLLAQHLNRRHRFQDIVASIINTEGRRGLWRGWPINLARAAVGGGAYFGTLSAMLAEYPHAHPLVVGLVATAVATIAGNPLDVVLARLYVGKKKPPGPRVYLRGLGTSLLRATLAKSFGWWGIFRLAKFLGAAIS